MKFSFHGAVRGVTGSCYLVETSQGRVLVDCGLFQGKRVCEAKECAKFAFDPEKIDAVLVTHAHLDHVGRLPLLVKHGFSGPIYATPPTKDLAIAVLNDALHVMSEEAEKHGQPLLYEETHVKEVEGMLKGRNKGTTFEVIPGLQATFFEAGHILGSSFLALDVSAQETKSGKAQRIVFSGDIGNDNIPILPDTAPIGPATIVIAESTYGDRDHDPVASRQEDVAQMATRVLSQGGTLVIPAFSIERTQELLYELDELVEKKKIPPTTIYLDSPLAIRATKLYHRYQHLLQFDRPISKSPDHNFFDFPGLQQTLSIDDSKHINVDPDPKIIIAGSGMMNGGRVQHHLIRYLPHEKNGLLIIGFQAPGTLGRKIQDGDNVVKIFREKIEVKAEVMSLDSFSAHGDRAKMARWLKTAEGLERVYLTHGDPEAKKAFQSYLKRQGIKADVQIPKFKQVVEI